ncbi:MAG: GNAT family N-acetyltransferase [Geminicoccaceae bacterium]
MAVHVREAVPADAETIAALVHALSREEGHSAPALHASQVRAEGFGASPRFRVLIAERDGRPAGYALFFPAYDTDHAERGFYLQDLYVLPEARRQGIGRALMAAVARACAADGGCYVFWNARPRNRAALAFYRRIGARREPTVTLSLQSDALRRLVETSSTAP